MTRCLPFLLLFFLSLLCFSAGIVEKVLGIDAETADLANRFLPPSFPHLLGTDELGRDVFIRLLQGGQVSLGVGFIAAVLTTGIGVVIGLFAGYAGKGIDNALMRLTDLLIALPLLPLLIILSAVDLGKIGIETNEYTSLYKMIFLIALTGWTTMARLTRARTLTIKEMDFVLAARALGVSHLKIIWRHILPNLMGTVLVALALLVGQVILIESVLSFLGLGLQPPVASWGNMLTGAESVIWEYPGLMIWPGLMIFLCIFSLNMAVDKYHKL